MIIFFQVRIFFKPWVVFFLFIGCFFGLWIRLSVPPINMSLTSGNTSNNCSTVLIFLSGNTISIPRAFSSIDINLWMVRSALRFLSKTPYLKNPGIDKKYSILYPGTNPERFDLRCPFREYFNGFYTICNYTRDARNFNCLLRTLVDRVAGHR